MLTLYHAPQSRSETILTLLAEMDLLDKVRVETVTIPRRDGSGGRDPANPHPEGKVPYLVNGDDHVRERGAIITYLTDMFPEAGMGPLPGDPKRGEYLGWLFWYQGVLEPVVILRFTEMNHPALMATFRDYDTAIGELNAVLSRQPYLLGEDFSAADLLVAAPFIFFADQMPATPAITEWVGRIQSRPSATRAEAAGG